MRPLDKNYTIDRDDYPYLRARPSWVSPEENQDNIQNEINIFADGQKLQQSIGRSGKREIQLKLKAISADHCAISYNQEKGWTITEKGKTKVSSNGTFIFMKSHDQIESRVPSGLIPLHEGMLISFVNYELKVSLESRTQHEINALANKA